MESLGSGVFTNSWGRGESHILTNIFSELAYQHPDILIIFSAGNEISASTINSPLTHKMC